MIFIYVYLKTVPMCNGFVICESVFKHLVFLFTNVFYRRWELECKYLPILSTILIEDKTHG